MWNRRGGNQGLVIALAMMGTACGGPEPIPEADVRERMLEAICGQVDDCACSSFESAISTEQDCRAYHEEAFDRMLESAEECGYRYNAECAGRWVEALEGLGCGQYDELDSSSGLWNAVGCNIYKIEEGQCWGWSSRLGAKCPNGQYMAGEVGNDVCVPFGFRGPGQSCALASQEVQVCVDGYFCKPDEQEPRGTCTRRAEVGEDCTWPSLCADDLVCDPLTDSCSQGVNAGGSCGEGMPACARDHYCSTDGTCTELPGEGETCHLDQEGAHCRTGFDCGADLTCWNDRPTVCVQAEMLG